MVWTKLLSRTALTAALAGGFLLLGVASVANAEDITACRRNIDKWEDRLERDINRHGFDSGQARHDRHELDEAHDHCHQRFGDRWRDDDHHDHDYGRR